MSVVCIKLYKLSVNAAGKLPKANVALDRTLPLATLTTSNNFTHHGVLHSGLHGEALCFELLLVLKHVHRFSLFQWYRESKPKAMSNVAN